jgi:hypothetical protein
MKKFFSGLKNRKGRSSNKSSPATTRPTTSAPGARVPLVDRARSSLIYMNSRIWSGPGCDPSSCSDRGTQSYCGRPSSDRHRECASRGRRTGCGRRTSGYHDGAYIQLLLFLYRGSIHGYMAQKARDWWNAHRGSILASTQFIFETVEKGLDGMPILGPKAAFGAMAGVVKAVRVRPLLHAPLRPSITIHVQTMDENNTTIEDIVEKVEAMNKELAQVTSSFASGVLAGSPSAEVAERLRKFNEFVPLRHQSIAYLMTTRSSDRQLRP